MRKIFSLFVAFLATMTVFAEDPEIIKVELSGNKGETQTVTGTIGGTSAVNLLNNSSAPYKLNNDGAYVSLTLASGNFEANDKVTITGADKAHQIYYGEPGSGELLLTTPAPASGVITCKLKGLPEGQNTIYLYRSSGTYNGKVTSISVVRPAPLPKTGDAELTYELTKGSVAVSGEATVSTLDANATEFAVSTLAIGSNNSKPGYCGQITGQAVDFADNSYVQLGFKVADGYVFNPSAAGITVFANSTADMKAKVIISDGTMDIESKELACASSADADIEFASDAFSGKKLEGDVTITIFMWGVASKRAYIKSPVTISGTVEFGCTAPTDPLALKLDTTKSEETGLYVGDKIKLTVSGAGNGNPQAITLDGAAFSGDEWPATAGEHTFLLSQEKKDDICGTDIEVKLVVAEKTPVAKAEIEGNATAVINKEATLTCKAENATNWQWYKGSDKIDGATSAEYKFTPDAEGNLSFSCEAWNKFTDPHVKSEAFEVEVTGVPVVCGLLATIEVSSKSAATLTGEFAGTANVKNLDDQSKNTSEYEGKKGYKLYKEGSSIGADFTDGTLKAKDKVIVFVTTTSAKMQIFGDKDGNKLLKEIDNVVQGENVIVLDDEAEGATGLYVIRKLGGDEGAKYNPHIAYIQLKRPCGEESSDASLKSLTIGGKKVDPDAEGVYNYEVPADYTEDQISIAYELNDAKAQADKPSPREVLVPEAGAEAKEVTITVTAEDGTQVVYVVKITKAAAQGGEEQPGGEQPGGEQPGGEQPGGEQPGGEQPGGDSDQAIDEVQGDRVQCTKEIRDGQLVILKNGTLYNAQGAILK